MYVPSLVKIPWHLSNYCLQNKNMGVSRADDSVKIWQNLPASNPKPDLHNMNAQTKFGENPWMFTQVISRKRINMGVSRAENAIKILWNLPISNPKPDFQNIDAHTKFGENPLMFTSRNEKWTDVQLTDRQTDGHTDVQRETIIPHHYHVQKCE